MNQAQPGLFATRVRVLLGNLSSDEMKALAGLAEKYGNGEIHLTMRQCVEIPFVRYDDLEAIQKELKDIGFKLGACGPRVRVITACQGTRFCLNALGDTHKLTTALDERYYAKGPLPHKFKMAVTGCSNNCIKPQDNDLGFVAAVEPKLDESACINCALCFDVCPAGAINIEDGYPIIDLNKCAHDGKCIQSCPTGALKQQKKGWQVFVGGKFGRKPQLGTLLAEFVDDEEAVDIAGHVLAVYEQEAGKRERLGDLINRISMEKFKEAVDGVCCRV
jgi:dissimilatory sulfite reductase (desulfoviridin) alpha/beta subunit